MKHNPCVAEAQTSTLLYVNRQELTGPESLHQPPAAPCQRPVENLDPVREVETRSSESCIPTKPTSGKSPSSLAMMESKSLPAPVSKTKSLLAPASNTICEIHAWPRTTASMRVLLPRHHGNSATVPACTENASAPRCQNCMSFSLSVPQRIGLVLQRPWHQSFHDVCLKWPL